MVAPARPLDTKGRDAMADHQTETRVQSADDFAAVAANRVALLYRRAEVAGRMLRRAEVDMAPAAVGQPVAPSADPWRCVPDRGQRPEHWALWALRWIEEARLNAATIGRASEAAEREAENVVWLLDSGSCSEYVQHTLRNALQTVDEVLGWYGDALQTVDDLRAKYDGWLSDMHRAYGTEGDDAALAGRLAAWRASRPRR